jgi:LysM repeat protein
LKLLFGIEEIAMASMKRGAMVASMLLLFSIIASACNQPYSTPPIYTSTPLPNSLFGSPIAQPTNMTDVQNLATASALALSGTPAVGVVTATPSGIIPPVGVGSVTPTTFIQLPTNSIPGTRPTTYSLQAGEFPFCIARRYNVDPDQLLALSGLVDGVIYSPGTTLTIPQSGSFPGDRMLQNHPTTYTVISSGETIYGIACKFGDVYPDAIASANGLSAGAVLTAGQQLSIP